MQDGHPALNGSNGSAGQVRKKPKLQERLALREQGKVVPIDTNFPEPPVGVWPQKPCSHALCWSHDFTTGTNPPLPWTEFHFDSRTRSGLQSQCLTCMAVAKLSGEAKEATLTILRTPPTLQETSVDSAEPQEVQAHDSPSEELPTAQVAPIAPPVTVAPTPKPPKLTPQFTPSPMIPLLFMTDEDGDRWCMPVAGDGPLYELGKLGSDTVRIHLSWTPADAPQTFTTTGDAARRLELLTRQLAAQAMACDATAVVEAIFLWEQEQLKREAAEREIQTTRTEMQATIDSLRIELDAALARAAETERRRVETAQRLTNVEADRVRLERQIKDMERSEVGELSGKLADALEEVVRLTNALNRANDENASLNEKLGEARRKNAKAMRELNKYRENDILLQSCAVGSPAA